MAGRIISLLISIGLIVGGLSGQLVLRGTNSSIGLIIVGAIILLLNILGMLLPDNLLIVLRKVLIIVPILVAVALIVSLIIIKTKTFDDTRQYTKFYSIFVYDDVVYIVGNDKSEQGFSHAVLWKNGIAHYLSDGSSYHSANSVFVCDDNVYIVGHDDTGPVLWINGVAQSISGGTSSIYVTGNDIYIAGTTHESNKNKLATLWHNGNLTILSDENGMAEAVSVFVFNGDVYVAGYVKNDKDIFVATLWVNGIAQNLSDGDRNAFTNSVFVYDNVVYVAGRERTSEKGTSVAMLWVNDDAISLTDGKNWAGATAVFRTEDHVYVAGEDGDPLTLWTYTMNAGVVQNLTDGNHARASKIESIFVADNDVYIVGNLYKDNGTIGTFWKNGVVQNLVQ